MNVPATAEQVKASKVEEFRTLYLALFSRYIEKLLQCNPTIEILIRNGIADEV